jgi:outer membrane protein OmpA-like peptidoglycan-associated protein
MLTKLNSTLNKGERYSMSFWIWKPSIYSDNNNFSVGLWKNEPTFMELHSETTNLIEVKDFSNSITGKWYRASVDFIAEDFFRYLSIGFHTMLPAHSRPPFGNPVGCYVDGLVLVCANAQEEEIVTLFKPSEVHINHHKPNNQLTNDIELIKLENEVSKLDTLPKVNFGEQNYFGVIQFEHNSFELQYHSQLALDSLAIVMKQNENYKILLIGHTDNTGTNYYNRELSLKRAQEVEAYLVEFGFDASRIEVKAMGSSHPIDNGITPEAMATNRRVEIVLIVEPK